jgi:hypothetical protein
MAKLLLKQIKTPYMLRRLHDSLNRRSLLGRLKLMTGFAADQYSFRFCYHKCGDVTVSYLSRTTGIDTVTFASSEWDCLVIYMGHLADMIEEQDEEIEELLDEPTDPDIHE